MFVTAVRRDYEGEGIDMNSGVIYPSGVVKEMRKVFRITLIGNIGLY